MSSFWPEHQPDRPDGSIATPILPTWILWLLFALAALGLIWQTGTGPSLDHQALALGAFVFCLDQGRMAVQDLKQVAVASTWATDARLSYFQWITLSTIVLELAGFYLAAKILGWGLMLVLFSQVWFNTLAPIKLQPYVRSTSPYPSTTSPPQPRILVVDRPLSQRGLIVLADVLALILLGLWTFQITPAAIVITLYTIAIGYATVKLILALQKLH